MTETTKAPAKAVARKAAASKVDAVPDPADGNHYTASLNEALARFQAEIPRVVRGDTANAGTYSYSYANLADITSAAFPLLAKYGLSFSTLPTFSDRDPNRFVLEYSLLHVSGDSRTGEYPLPDKAPPQALGSAITYARRYCLCAVTGIAPDDDDGAEAQRHAERPAPPVESDTAWIDTHREAVKQVVGQAGLDAQWDNLVAAADAGRITPADFETLRGELGAHARYLKEFAKQKEATEGTQPAAVAPVVEAGPVNMHPATGATPDPVDAAVAAMQAAGLDPRELDPTDGEPDDDGPPMFMEGGERSEPEMAPPVVNVNLPTETPTGNPQRMKTLGGFVSKVSSTDALLQMFENTAVDWASFTPEEQATVKGWFDSAYMALTGEHRPPKPADWKMGVKRPRD